MKRLVVPSVTIPLVAGALLLTGCASSSGSTASSASSGSSASASATASAAGSSSASSPPRGVVATSPAAGSSSPTGSAPPSSATTSASTSSPPTSSAPTSSAPGAGGVRLPASATSAEVTYLGPKMAKPVRVAKTVTGATYKRLAEDLEALAPEPPNTAQCMVLTGENATVTIAAGGHTWVFTVEGSLCRPVRVTKDGVAQPRLANSMTLLNQLRAIAGFTGMAHPLTG